MAKKSARELELEQQILAAAVRYYAAKCGSAEERMALRQLEGIRRGSQLGAQLMEEFDCGGLVTARHWS